MIPEHDREKLLNFARESISSFFTGKEPKKLKIDDEISRKTGVFVTLKKNGELRGCIGYTEPFYPLYEGIKNAAHAAAFNDPRFPPLTEEELKEITIEISVLTEPELIEVTSPEEYENNIKIGEDGLIIKAEDGRGGLLLPQVATEQGWNAEQFLEHLCKKAGLQPGDWKDKSNEIYKFQVQKFSDE